MLNGLKQQLVNSQITSLSTTCKMVERFFSAIQRGFRLVCSVWQAAILEQREILSSLQARLESQNPEQGFAWFCTCSPHSWRFIFKTYSVPLLSLKKYEKMLFSFRGQCLINCERGRQFCLCHDLGLQAANNLEEEQGKAGRSCLCAHRVLKCCVFVSLKLHCNNRNQNVITICVLQHECCWKAWEVGAAVLKAIEMGQVLHSADW